jgi:DUF2975 family protein
MVRSTARTARDWTRGLQLVTTVAAIGAAIAVLFWLATIAFYLLQRASGSSDVTVGATLPSARLVDPVPPAQGLADNVSFTTGDSLSVAIHRPEPAQYLLAVMERLPTLVVYALFFTLLTLLVRAARRDNPFTTPIARKLRGLGALLLLGTLAAALVESLAQGWLTAELLPTHGFVFDYDLPTGAVIGGIGMLAIAEIVRRGVRMREDLEGTV